MLGALDRRFRVAGAPVLRLRASRPHRYADPILVGVVSLVVYALHGYDGALDRDLGVFVYGGEHVAHGVPPYVGIFNSVGPLADAVPGLAIWLAHLVNPDADPILVARLLFTLLSALCCALLCVLGRDTFGSRVAGYVAPAVFLTFQRFIQLASDGPREKTTMVVFLIACLVLLGRRRWFGAGVCAALATLTWQPSLLVALVALLAAWYVDPRRVQDRILTRFVLGGLLPTAVTVCYFLAAGALSRAVDGFVVVNAGYTSQPGAITAPRQTAKILWTGYHWTLLLVVVGLGLALVVAARALPAARQAAAPDTARRLVLTGAGAAAALLWSLAVINGSPDLFVVLPSAALGVTGGILLLLGRLGHTAGLRVAVGVVALAVVVAGVESVTSRDDMLLKQRADVEAVLDTQPADATVASLDAPQVLALSGRDNPIPYQLFSDSMDRYLHATYAGGLRGVLSQLRLADPTFVAVGTTFHAAWATSWLSHDYVRVGSGGPCTWYLIRSAGAAALARAHHAHRQVMAAYRQGRR